MEEEAALEVELEAQLSEHQASLEALEAALMEDQSEELLQVQKELREAAQAAQEGLLHLKRSRLLREIDTLQAVQASSEQQRCDGADLTSIAVQDGTAGRNEEREMAVRLTHGTPLGSPNTDAGPASSSRFGQGWEGGQGQEEEGDGLEGPKWPVGSRCRFRHTDGRWYTGEVLAWEGHSNERERDWRGMESSVVRVGLAHPTAETLQVCRFFRHNRCRFNDSCRQSHGFLIPAGTMRPYSDLDLPSLPLGSRILASPQAGGLGVWHEAELESKDLVNNQYTVAFVEDGARAEVGPECIAPLEYMDDDISSESDDVSASSEGDVEEQEDVEDYQGLGDGSGIIRFPEAEKMTRAGVQTETINFAHWEQHTRGIASKMMAAMGFRRGMGLGKEGQGIAEPLEVRVLPPKKALDFINEDVEKGEGVEDGNREGGRKKMRKGRGGERRRRQKWAKAMKRAKADKDQEFAPDVFTFINGQLAKSGTRLASDGGKLESVQAGGERKNAGRNTKGASAPKEDRRALLAREHELSGLATKIIRLEEMAQRNKRDKSVYAAVQTKLGESRRALAEAQAAHASTRTAIHQMEETKKWMKF